MSLNFVPVRTLSRFLEAVGAHPHEDLSQLARYAGMSTSTAKRALPALETLDVIAKDSSGRYIAQSDRIGRGTDSNQLRQVIRRALFMHRPFELICEGISLGETEDEAIRKSMVLLGAESTERSSLETLIRLGEELDIISRDEEHIVLHEEVEIEDINADTGLPTADDVSSEARARLYNATHLGIDAHNYLDEVDRDLLTKALLNASSSPERSLEQAGKVTENFLREVAADRGLSLEAGKKNGAGQLATMLRSKGLLHSHHVNLVLAVATLRNSQGHSKDKSTKEIWCTDSRTAFWAVHGALTVIRSVFEYTFNNSYIL